MATANEILASHTHVVIDDDTHYIIDPLTRQMSNGSESENILMQNDHDSERYTFELPRYIDGHDMMLCNRVRVHYNNYSEDTGLETTDVYEVDDFCINPENKDTVICTWLISKQATQQPGVLSFLIAYSCVADDSTVVYEWHTDICSSIIVKPGRDNGEVSVVKYSDIIEQWRQKLFGTGDTVIASIETAVATQLDEIEAKGAATLESIPDDYTEVANMADDALRRKADAIFLNESGEYIYLDDSSDNNLIGLNLYGKTTQTQTTGKNLLPYPYGQTTHTVNGITFTDNGDGSITINGTCTSYSSFVLAYETNETAQTMLGKIKGNIFTVSGNSAGTIQLTVQKYNSDKSADEYRVIDGGSSATYMDDGNDGSWKVFIAVLNGTTLSNVVIKPMVELSDVATEYEPYTAGLPSPSPDYPQDLVSIENPETRIVGKNLITELTIGTNPSNYTVCLSAEAELQPDTDYVISFVGTEGHKVYTNEKLFAYVYVLCNGTRQSVLVHTKATLDKSNDSQYTSDGWIILKNSEGNTIIPGFTDVQIEKGSTLTVYEAFRTPQVMQSTYTLRGLPVSQNGNYTDFNGRQWICDEIDFENGKFIQRVASTVIDGTENWVAYSSENGLYRYNYNDTTNTLAAGSAVCQCSHYQSVGAYATLVNTWMNASGATHAQYRIVDDKATVDEFKAYLQSEYVSGNPVTINYILATPIETDLTATELEAFKVLTTNATNTTILNDQNAMMAVKYNADIEQYIYKNVTSELKTRDIVLKDKVNGKSYKIYVFDGSLAMEETEV